MISVPDNSTLLGLDVHKLTAAGSPMPATHTFAPSSSSPPGPTRPIQRSAPSCAILRHRQEGLDPGVAAGAWTAQLRLCGRFHRLDQRKSNRKSVVTAIA